MAQNSVFVPLYFVCGVLVVVVFLASAAASSAYRVADDHQQRIGRAFSVMPRLPPTSRRSRQVAASVTPPPSQARIKLQPPQLEALLALDQALLALWNNSASNVFCDEWGRFAVKCNQDGMVTGLNLVGMYLDGTLSCSISRLTALQSLRIGEPQADLFPYAYLTNTPTDLLSLSIEPLHLDLSFLPITRLPQWIASLSKLTYLDVTGNLIVHRSAPFPTEWMALTRLKSLRAGLNGFTGSIPSTISALTALTNLELYGNNISGSIPAGISKLLKLNSLALGFNNLTGAVPGITRAPLSYLQLQGNTLSGSLPNFASWKTPLLRILNVSDNQLSGSLPDSISHLTLLQTLGLGGNNLSGVISASLGGLPVLTYLNVSGTGLTSPDGSKCMVKQSNTTGFCRLCFSFCSSCTPLALSAPTKDPAWVTDAPPAPQARPASGPRTLITAAINHSTAAAIAAVLLLVFGM
ncbi:unnamed protein product [Closterium sp. Yama58-4]|nr:unnamed protein product [Closterium sp. Yama58-4]